MATSTYLTQLMVGTTVGNVTTYAKLLDIKDFPDMGGAPEALETTTLSDAVQKYIAGIKSSGVKEFTTNYDKTLFTTIVGMAGIKKYAVWFGTLGVDGKFTFDGDIFVYGLGAGINGVREMKVGIIPSSDTLKVPPLGALTVTSTASETVVGKTAITVTPVKEAGNSYVYKTASAVALPMYDDVLTTGWTAWAGVIELTATTGDEIVIAEVTTSDKLARKAGKDTVISKAE